MYGKGGLSVNCKPSQCCQVTGLVMVVVIAVVLSSNSSSIDWIQDAGQGGLG